MWKNLYMPNRCDYHTYLTYRRSGKRKKPIVPAECFLKCFIFSLSSAQCMQVKYLVKILMSIDAVFNKNVTTFHCTYRFNVLYKFSEPIQLILVS